MIIEPLQQLRDKILQYQTYFDKGFAEVVMVEKAGRPGVYSVEDNGFQEVVSLYNSSFFYFRAVGPVDVKGDNMELQLASKYKLVACAKNVDMYKFAACLASALKTFCNGVSITSIETRVLKVITDEFQKEDVILQFMQRIDKQVIISIDFTMYEGFALQDLRKCECNPCKNC